MEYRTNKRTGDKISIIGLGASYIGSKSEKDALETIEYALENGINYFDLASGHAATFPYYGKAFKEVRDKVMFQIHFGADYTTGVYGWSLDLETIKRSVSWQLENLKTDYIDYGFIHCIDEVKDFETYEKNGVLDYILSLKEKGVIKHIGLSSHTPKAINKVLDLGIVDMLMFSVNPLYDDGLGEYARGNRDERNALYLRCEKENVGISCMKPFSGGQLLDAAKSPYSKALSKVQCISYALSRPSVLTVLPGASSVKELKECLEYLNASAEEKDFSAIAGLKKRSDKLSCTYCQHCHPCPKGLDIALINKYYDLSLLGDDMAKEHYLSLEKKAGDCISCGHCDRRCPFHVKQSERMSKIKKYFGQ